MSETQKAEQEISTIFSMITLGGLVVPGLIAFLMGKINAVAVWLLNQGILEKSDRVLLSLNNGIGLDLGRVLILAGVSLLCAVALGHLARIMNRASATQQRP